MSILMSRKTAALFIITAIFIGSVEMVDAGVAPAPPQKCMATGPTCVMIVGGNCWQAPMGPCCEFNGAWFTPACGMMGGGCGNNSLYFCAGDEWTAAGQCNPNVGCVGGRPTGNACANNVAPGPYPGCP